MLRSKTTWMGIAGLIAAATSYFTGQIDGWEAAQAAFFALQTIFLRHAIQKGAGS